MCNKPYTCLLMAFMLSVTTCWTYPVVSTRWARSGGSWYSVCCSAGLLSFSHSLRASPSPERCNWFSALFLHISRGGFTEKYWGYCPLKNRGAKWRTPKAGESRVVSLPQPTRGSGELHELTQWGPGPSPAVNAFCRIL